MNKLIIQQVYPHIAGRFDILRELLVTLLNLDVRLPGIPDRIASIGTFASDVCINRGILSQDEKLFPRLEYSPIA